MSGDLKQLENDTITNVADKKREGRERESGPNARTVVNFNRVENTRVPKSKVHEGFSLLVFSFGSPAMPQEISALLVQPIILFLGSENLNF